MRAFGVCLTVWAVTSVSVAGAELLPLPLPEVRAPGLPPIDVPEVLPSVPEEPDVPQVPEIPLPEVPDPPDVTPPSPVAPDEGGGPASPQAPGGSDTPTPGSSSTRPSADGGTGGERSATEPSTRLTGGAAPPPQRSLRSVVEQLEGCLSDLAATQRGVLVLRAGLGPRSALSPAQVARRLDRSLAQVRSIERRGLHRLRELSRTGACASAGSSLSGSSGSGAVAAAPFDGASGSRLGATSGDAGDTLQGAVKGTAAQSGDGDSGSLLWGPAEGRELALALVAIAAALALLGLVIRHQVGQR